MTEKLASILFKTVHSLYFDGHNAPAFSLFKRVLSKLPKSVLSSAQVNKTLRLGDILTFHQHAGTLASFVEDVGTLLLESIKVFVFCCLKV